MARFIFSNNADIVTKFTEHCVSVGFTKYSEIKEAKLYGTVFSKLGVDNVDYYAREGDFVAIVGTYFYKKHFAG